MSPEVAEDPTTGSRLEPTRRTVIATLGFTQILAWGSSYYLPAVLAEPIKRDTHWPLTWVVSGLSVGLVLAALVSPHVGKAIERSGGRRVLALGTLAIGMGQLGLAVAPNLTAYISAWVVIGAGMGAGLYDAAFATLGAAVRPRRSFGHHDVDPVRRLRQHRLLATLRVPRL